MSTNTYDLGEQTRIVGTFIALAGPVDPANVYVSWKTPAGVVTTLQYGVDASVIRQTQGEYYYDLDLDESGKYSYVWYSEGSGKGAAETTLLVRRRKTQ